MPRSYAAIFGLREDLTLQGEEYSWLSSSFYFGWLIWAIPSNLLMQRSPPGYYLAFNIFMWGALLMAQAAAKNFAGLLSLRILSGAFEAIADPAFMLITSMYFTRAEQPTRISIWYAFNGVGVAGGGLIGLYSSSILAYDPLTVRNRLRDWQYPGSSAILAIRISDRRCVLLSLGHCSGFLGAQFSPNDLGLQP
jgi:MFS family permease